MVEVFDELRELLDVRRLLSDVGHAVADVGDRQQREAVEHAAEVLDVVTLAIHGRQSELLYLHITPEM